jgi:holo-[acyl-carrier protein] synthase
MDISLPPGGIVLGIGADIIEVERIRGVLERQGERFLNRVFTEEERAYCSSMKYPTSTMPRAFAAKEAVSKCFSTGNRAELGWKSVSIYHGDGHQAAGSPR